MLVPSDVPRQRHGAATDIGAIGWGVTLLISGLGIHRWSTHATA